jgi:serine/tyrosine/threonine adenylyltransferase
MPETAVRPLFRFDNSYARELSGLAAPWQPTAVSAPAMLYFNRALADELGLAADALAGDRGAAIFAGNEVPEGATPIAQAYAGHQFGHFSPSLGDGRALLLGEVIDRDGRRRDIAFKGSGRTPFSRGGDGKAAVGPVLREVILGEAMHALGIPTTRALAAVATGEPVFREDSFPGAVLTRVAASHLRVGTFQYFSSRGQLDLLRQLADYAIRRHDPGLADHPDRYFELLRAVAERQAALIARWMHVGFIHGVMNTDNMTISGETIDYGPCAFMEAHDPGAVFSSIDTHGRYAYANQPLIARWNLARLAEALLPLIDVDDPERAVARATEVIDAFPAQYDAHWLRGAREKLGLAGTAPDDAALAHDWLALLQAQAIDHTLAWRHLADAVEAEGFRLQALFEDTRPLMDWLARWRQRGAQEAAAPAQRASGMRRASPIYIARNHRVEEALAAASMDGDLGPFNRLLEVLAQPFDERAGLEAYAAPAAPEVTARYRTFCGT